MAHHLQRRARSPACASSCTVPSPASDAGDLANVPPADLQEPGTNSSCGRTWETEALLLKDLILYMTVISVLHTYPSPGTSLSLSPRAWSWLEKLTNSSPSSPGGLFFLSLARARRAALSSLFLSKSYFLFPFMGFPNCFLDMMELLIYPSRKTVTWKNHNIIQTVTAIQYDTQTEKVWYTMHKPNKNYHLYS